MHNLTSEGIWFRILLKSMRLVGAAGRYEGTHQLKEPDLKYVNDKKETLKVLQNIFYLEKCYLSGISMLLQYLTSPQKITTKIFAHSAKPRQTLFYREAKE